MTGALAGIVVVEQSGRLAARMCGALLAELGATVLSVGATPADPFAAGKIPVRGGDWHALMARAHVAIVSSGRGAGVARRAAMAGRRLVLCSVTPFGLKHRGTASDYALQALTGLMATTGEPGGPPEPVHAPLLDGFAGLNAAAAVLAALELGVPEDGVTVLDQAIVDSAVALLGTHVSHAVTGRGRGHRTGTRHPLCAPWAAYPAADGVVQICVASDPQWARLAALLGRPELAEDPRLRTSAQRVAAVEEVDALVGSWVAERSADAAVAVLREARLPAARARGINRNPGRCRPVAGLERGAVWPLVPPAAAEAPDLAPTGKVRPLEGIRVLEVGPYTAGPLGGRYLADLGAEVIKVEPPGGENSRGFRPLFGETSGYFANYNAGKHSLVLDLAAPAGRRTFADLARTADVVVENLKPGDMDRFGIGPRRMTADNPDLVWCAVSGYGATAGPLAALDSVIQAEAGVMALVGDGGRPLKVGLSIADLVAANIVPIAVLAALRQRRHDGRGQVADVSMLHGLRWLLQAAPEGARPVRLAAADGWVLAEPPPGVAIGDVGPSDRATLCRILRNHGVAATSVLELDEVLAHPIVRRRELLSTAMSPGHTGLPVIAPPFRVAGRAAPGSAPRLDDGRALLSGTGEATLLKGSAA
ncbi:MAG TPA: CoA transferase [Azospirillum sp.]|nr:CoA transferase [Azospirillum sp.]